MGNEKITTISTWKKNQTDHRALVWLHNVKDPSSRLLRWRLRMEEYEYEIEYVKGKKIKVADRLSRLFPITADTLKQAMKESRIPEEEDSQSETEELEKLLPKIETSNTPIIIEDNKLTEENKIKLLNKFNNRSLNRPLYLYFRST